MSSARKARHKRPTPNYTRQGVALAATTVVSAGVVIGGAGAAGAAENPASQSRGWFLSGSALGTNLDNIVELQGARAVNTGSPAVVREVNPLSATLLNSINVPVGPVNLLGDNGFLTLGAVNQAAIARSNGSAIGASGAVTDSGAIAVDGQNDVPAANATFDLEGLLGSSAGAGLEELVDVDLEVGALAASAKQERCPTSTQDGGYRIAQMKLALESPLLAGVLSTLSPQLQTLLNGAEGDIQNGGFLTEGIPGTAAIPGVPAVEEVIGVPAVPAVEEVIGVPAVPAVEEVIGSPEIPATVDPITGLELTPLIPAVEAVAPVAAIPAVEAVAPVAAIPAVEAVAPVAAIPAVDAVDAVLAGLIPANLIEVDGIPTLSSLLTNTTLGGNGPVTVDLTNGRITVDVEALLQSIGLDINNLPPNTELVDLILNAINDRVLQLVTDELDALADRITNQVGDVTVTVAGVPLSGANLDLLDGVLDGLVADLLVPVNGQNNLLAEAGVLDPLFGALADVLSLRVNVQESSNGQFTQRALVVRVLPGSGGDGLARVNLASASVGPGNCDGADNSGRGDKDGDRDNSTPLPDTGAAESAPLAAAGLALMLAGAVATAGAGRLGNSSRAHAGARGRGSSGGGRHARR